MSEWDQTTPLPPPGGSRADAPRLPQEIGPYRVIDRLEGGMGIVYVAS